MLARVREKSHVAGVLDGRGKLALILGAGAGRSARGDLPIGIDEALEKFHILVVDVLDVVLREVANLLARAHFLVSHGYCFLSSLKRHVIVFDVEAAVKARFLARIRTRRGRARSRRHIAFVAAIANLGAFGVEELDTVAHDFCRGDIVAIPIGVGPLLKAAVHPDKAALVGEFADRLRPLPEHRASDEESLLLAVGTLAVIVDGNPEGKDGKTGSGLAELGVAGHAANENDAVQHVRFRSCFLA